MLKIKIILMLLTTLLSMSLVQAEGELGSAPATTRSK